MYPFGAVSGLVENSEKWLIRFLLFMEDKAGNIVRLSGLALNQKHEYEAARITITAFFTGKLEPLSENSEKDTAKAEQKAVLGAKIAQCVSCTRHWQSKRKHCVHNTGYSRICDSLVKTPGEETSVDGSKRDMEEGDKELVSLGEKVTAEMIMELPVLPCTKNGERIRQRKAAQLFLRDNRAVSDGSWQG